MSAGGRFVIWKLVILLGRLSGPTFADRTIEGQVTVVRDVDTLVMAGTPVWLNGVDGREAPSFMTQLVRGRTVTC